MRRKGFIAILAFCSVAHARPSVNAGGIVNAASYSPGIAQGSLFVVFGSQMGPDPLVTASTLPLSTSLGGTTVTVWYTGGSQNVPLVYVSGKQLAGVLPSNAPIGAATLTISNGGQTSDAASFQIVRSNFALFTSNSSGSGPAVAQNFNSGSDQPVNTPAAAAAPGQVVTLWGTGLGPITGSDAGLPPAGTLNQYVQVMVGGVAVTPAYAGRSGCCAGADQISFRVPAGVEGCKTPVQVRVPGSPYFQQTTIAIAPARTACTSAGTAAEYYSAHFRFTYPSSLHVDYSGTDPSDSRFTLVRLIPNQTGIEQVFEVRYTPLTASTTAWFTKGSSLTDAAGEKYIGGPSFTYHFSQGPTTEGFSQTNTLGDFINHRTWNVIGYGVESRADFAHVAYVYDSTQVNTGAEAMVERTLAFATLPILTNDWNNQGDDLTFSDNGRVDVNFYSSSISGSGTYSLANNRLAINFTYANVPMSLNCAYQFTLGWLLLDCGKGAQTYQYVIGP